MRLAQRRDTKKVAQLFRELDHNLSLKDLVDLIQNKRVVLFKKKQKTLGAFSFAKIGIGIFTLLYVRKLVVDKEFRRRGLGGRMLKKLARFAHRRRADGFFLWSRASAKSFYRKNKLKSWWRIFWKWVD